MIKQYVAYDSTGMIVQWGHCPEDALELQARATGKSIAEGVGHPDTHYVLNGAVTERQPNPTTLSGLVLSNVPVPSVVEIDNVKYDCADSTVELDFPHAGSYAVTVYAFPLLPVSFGVTV